MDREEKVSGEGFFSLDNIAERQHSIPKVPTHPDPRVEDEQELRCAVECSSRDQAESGGAKERARGAEGEDGYRGCTGRRRRLAVELKSNRRRSATAGT